MKQKILFITAFPPNKNTAGQNYTRQLIEDLSKDYEIEIICWEYSKHKIEINGNIKYTKIKVSSIFRNPLRLLLFPLFSKRFSFKSLKLIRQKSKIYDIIYFDFSQVFIYSLFIKHPFKIGMSHDVIFQKYSRIGKYSIIKPWIKFSEFIALKNLNKIFTFSSKDKALLTQYYNKQCEIVPFYIEKSISSIDLHNLSLEDYFVMYGAWGRPENEESLKWVLDNYPVSRPQIKIIGGNLSNVLKEKIAFFSEIEYLGFIDNPYLIIARSKGLIAPLFHGAGVKVKAIEALSLGTPIIGNEITFEGLPNIEASPLYNVSSKEEFDNALNELENCDISYKIIVKEEFNKIYQIKSFKSKLTELLNTL